MRIGGMPSVIFVWNACVIVRKRSNYAVHLNAGYIRIVSAWVARLLGLWLPKTPTARVFPMLSERNEGKTGKWLPRGRILHLMSG